MYIITNGKKDLNNNDNPNNENINIKLNSLVKDGKDINNYCLSSNNNYLIIFQQIIITF